MDRPLPALLMMSSTGLCTCRHCERADHVARGQLAARLRGGSGWAPVSGRLVPRRRLDIDARGWAARMEVPGVTGAR